MTPARKTSSAAAVFSDWQPRYAEHNIPTFPVRFIDGDKKPAVAGYLQMGLPASRDVVVRFGHYDAFGFALKRAKVTVLDVDTPDERVLADALDRHGPTPLIVRTQSGNWQAWYRNSGERRSVRPFSKLPIDILGDGYVVAPPSIGAKGTYGIVQGTLDDLAHLPRMQGLAAPANENRVDGDFILAGARNKELLKHCMRHAPACDTEANLLDVAMTFANDTFDRVNGHPFTDADVSKAVTWAWDKTEAGENWCGVGRRVALNYSVVDTLAASDPHACSLLTILKRHHWGRERFVLAKAMAERLGWSTVRFKKARDHLVRCDLIRCVHQGGKGPHDPPVYIWGEGI